MDDQNRDIGLLVVIRCNWDWAFSLNGVLGILVWVVSLF